MSPAANTLSGLTVTLGTHLGPADTEFRREIEVLATGAPPDVAARLFEAGIPLARHDCAEEIARASCFWPVRTARSDRRHGGRRRRDAHLRGVHAGRMISR
jgi:hypothetical protein